MDKINFQKIYRGMHQKEKNSKLHTFISEKRMSSEDRQKGTYYANVIFDCLKNKGMFKVSRVRLVGSVGKATALVGSDFDLIAFVNDELPPFKATVLQSFESILKTSCIQKNLKNFKCTEYSVQFDISGYKFDVLPAPNFETAKKRQMGGAHKYMRDLYEDKEENYKMYSTALAEYAVAFVKERTQFEKDVIILAKAWCGCIDGMGYISGKSMLIELVAIYANIRRKKKNILTGFVRFLKMMAEFRSIKVIFLKYYKWDDVPEDIQGKPCIILDPANPWNNLANGVNKCQIQLFSTAAVEMLCRLEMFGKGSFDVKNDLFAIMKIGN